MKINSVETSTPKSPTLTPFITPAETTPSPPEDDLLCASDLNVMRKCCADFSSQRLPAGDDHKLQIILSSHCPHCFPPSWGAASGRFFTGRQTHCKWFLCHPPSQTFGRRFGNIFLRETVLLPVNLVVDHDASAGVHVYCTCVTSKDGLPVFTWMPGKETPGYSSPLGAGRCLLLGIPSNICHREPR